MGRRAGPRRGSCGSNGLRISLSQEREQPRGSLVGRRAFEALDRYVSEIDNIDWSVPDPKLRELTLARILSHPLVRLSLRVNVETLKNSPIPTRKPCTDSLFGFGIARRRMARFSSAPHVGIETCRNKVELKVTRRLPRRHRLRPPLNGPSRQRTRDSFIQRVGLRNRRILAGP